MPHFAAASRSCWNDAAVGRAVGRLSPASVKQARWPSVNCANRAPPRPASAGRPLTLAGRPALPTLAGRAVPTFAGISMPHCLAAAVRLFPCSPVVGRADGRDNPALAKHVFCESVSDWKRASFEGWPPPWPAGAAFAAEPNEAMPVSDAAAITAAPTNLPSVRFRGSGFLWVFVNGFMSCLSFVPALRPWQSVRTDTTTMATEPGISWNETWRIAGRSRSRTACSGRAPVPGQTLAMRCKMRSGRRDTNGFDCRRNRTHAHTHSSGGPSSLNT